MKWKRLAPVALGLLLVGSATLGHAQTNTPSSSEASTPAKAHRVLFALTSGDEADWRLTLGNIHNLLVGLPADSVQVEVVSYGGGLSFVRKTSSAAADIEALLAKHVRFAACENSMRMQHVTVADLVPGVEPVPSGIVEVVTKQEQGWTYIKAGR